MKSLHFENDEFPLWRDKVRDLIGLRLGETSEEFKRFRGPMSGSLSRDPAVRQRDYFRRVSAYETQLNSIIQRLELKLQPTSDVPTDEDPGEASTVKLIRIVRIFIAHDGKTQARRKLEDFIRALGGEPIIAESEPTKGRSITEKVDSTIDSCQYAVAIATRANSGKQDGKLLARSNVVNELPRIRDVLGDRWMIALEHGVELPSNESATTFERFSPQSMDTVFTALLSSAFVWRRVHLVTSS